MCSDITVSWKNQYKAYISELLAKTTDYCNCLIYFIPKTQKRFQILFWDYSAITEQAETEQKLSGSACLR
jgi:hypothetical protein